MVANVKTPIPGPNSRKYKAISDKYESHCLGYQAPIVWDHARGVTVWDVDDNTFLDWTSGVLVTNVGHAHPKLAEAISKQAGRLLNCYDFPTVERVTLAERMVGLAPDNLDNAFFATVGSEAVDSAVRVAKRHKNGFEIISFFGGFHGRTMGTMSLAGKMSTKKRFGPVMPGMIYVPFPDPYRNPFGSDERDVAGQVLEFMDPAVNAQSTGAVAGLIIEPYQGASGFIFPPDGFLKSLEQWCRERGIVFILDEVQSSFGRTGKFLALEWEDLHPNLVSIGKGIGSGMPISCLLAESGVMASLDQGDMSSTWGGNPICCASTHAILDIFEEENLVENSRVIGEHMKKRLTGMMEKCRYLGDVRGRGLVMGLDIVKDKKTKERNPEMTRTIINRCCENGLIIGAVSGNVIRVAPPLVITKDEADESLDIMEKVLTSLD
ncbi:MAG: aspartate aminotransferase family protein [Candidatus Latescibacteria bacterium]|nr:aspartate aminotransferase family protein [Candidatus Latescibacterota bacterium]